MSDAASDARPSAHDEAPRPRPQYGEYATAEEQRARIRQPDATHALETGQSVAPPAEKAQAAPAARAASGSAGTVGAFGAAGAPPRPRTVDRIVTVALLAYGLFTVLTSLPAFLDYGAYAQAMFAVMGVDAELADAAAGRPWGIAAAIVLGVGWIATALLSWWSLRRGRVTWWIPLVAGVVFTFAAGMLMVVPLINDPAVWDALVGSLR